MGGGSMHGRIDLIHLTRQYISDLQLQVLVPSYLDFISTGHTIIANDLT